MMKPTELIVLLGLGLPFYSYVGYPVVLFILGSAVQLGRDIRYLVARGERRRRDDHLPMVSLVIAAHNEEQVIERTLQRCLELDYPRQRLEVIIGSDGSSDATNEIVQRFAARGVTLLPFDQRRGKLAVLRDMVQHARGEILILSDANTELRPDIVRLLVRHFRDSRVGAVCGELHFMSPTGAPVHEGVYWRYELVLKILESRCDSALGANGALYAMRRVLFPKKLDNVINDDFVIPMSIRAAGYRVLYDPEAVAEEEAPASQSDEFRRRVRIGAGNLQSLWRCRRLLLPSYGIVSLAFWSHKVLRWFTPLLLVTALVVNVLLLFDSPPVWWITMWAQLAIYAGGVLGWLLVKFRLPAGPLRVVYYFLLINMALALGLAHGLLRRQRQTWQRTARGPLAEEKV